MSILGQRLRDAAAAPQRNACVLDVGDDQVTIYATPLTGMDMEWISRKHKDFAANPTVGAAVDLIIRKAETEDGEKAFDVEDKTWLLSRSMDFLTRIRNDLFPGGESDLGEEAIEEDLKN